jgi:demethylmenaquinone methyltransferase/2-methoxy-6-polyprenyl-1,4-benzoquinol methylase
MTQPDDLDSEMVRYYSARAAEYDEWYLRSGRYAHGDASDIAWQAELDAAARWLENLPLEGQIVELAAGTGWWSPALARKGRLHLYDASPETLDIARARLGGVGLEAEFVVRDVWAEPDRIVNAVFAGFWLSHVSRDRLVEFMSLARRWLVPGGAFAFIDSRPDPESGAVDHAPPEAGIQQRLLDDGSTYRVRKIHYSATELRQALEAAGFAGVDLTETSRFFVLGRATA